MRPIYLLPVLLLLAGCELFGPESGSVHVRTVQDTYTPADEVTIRFDATIAPA